MAIPESIEGIEALINQRAFEDYQSSYPPRARRYAAIIFLSAGTTGRVLERLSHLSRALVVTLSNAEATAAFALVREGLRDLDRDRQLMTDFGLA